jgi:hypothetical protein
MDSIYWWSPWFRYGFDFTNFSKFLSQFPEFSNQSVPQYLESYYSDIAVRP